MSMTLKKKETWRNASKYLAELTVHLVTARGWHTTAWRTQKYATLLGLLELAQLPALKSRRFLKYKIEHDKQTRHCGSCWSLSITGSRFGITGITVTINISVNYKHLMYGKYPWQHACDQKIRRWSKALPLLIQRVLHCDKKIRRRSKCTIFYFCNSSLILWEWQAFPFRLFWNVLIKFYSTTLEHVFCKTKGQRIWHTYFAKRRVNVEEYHFC